MSFEKVQLLVILLAPYCLCFSLSPLIVPNCPGRHGRQGGLIKAPLFFADPFCSHWKHIELSTFVCRRSSDFHKASPWIYTSNYWPRALLPYLISKATLIRWLFRSPDSLSASRESKPCSGNGRYLLERFKCLELNYIWKKSSEYNWSKHHTDISREKTPPSNPPLCP